MADLLAEKTPPPAPAAAPATDKLEALLAAPAASSPGPGERGEVVAPPITDVWSRTQPKYRRRAILLLVVNFGLYCGLCVFSHWLHVARPFEVALRSYTEPFQFWGNSTQNLNDFILYPINVDQTPMHGVVLGLLVASIVAVPISVSILYRFASALPFVAAVFVFAHMPWMAATLLMSCILASIRPFRMSFRFGSALVGMLPVLLYLYLATRPSPDQLATFASPEQKLLLAGPWLLAILAACTMLGVILAIAGAVKYRPGAVAPVMAVMFATPAILFHAFVGVDELTYRVLEQNYGPRSERFEPVQDATDRIGTYWEEWLQSGTLTGSGRAALRAVWSASPAGLTDLKQLVVRRMRSELLADRREAFEACKDFIADHPGSRYVPNVLYTQARVLDTRMDERKLVGEGVQRELYTDFPHVQSEPFWLALLNAYPQSPLATAARLRVAQLRLRRGDTDTALQMLDVLLAQPRPETPGAPETQPVVRRLLRSEPPEASLALDVGPYFIEARRLRDLVALNRDDPRYGDRPLRELAALDPHRPEYAAQLARLAREYRDATLFDNLVVRWATAALARDEQMERLTLCVAQLPPGDALPEALFRLADMEVQAPGPENEQRRSIGIARLRDLRQRFVGTIWAQEAADRLRILEPAVAQSGAPR